MSTGWTRDAALDAERLERVGADGRPTVAASVARHRVDRGARADEVDAHLGADDPQLADGHVRVELERHRAGPPVDRARADERHHAPLVGAVDDLGLHPDPEPVERRRQLRAEAGIGVEPRRRRRRASSRNVDVELALRA